jgi:5S rRNA maturation endonuclease (ribonuclease M5)
MLCMDGHRSTSGEGTPAPKGEGGPKGRSTVHSALILVPRRKAVETKQKIKLLEKTLRKLREGWLFVEGRRDVEAMRLLGCRNVLTISGNLRLSCGRVAEQGVETVFVLTDLDRRGDQLAMLAKGELEAHSVRAELTARKTIGRILGIRCFEDAKRGYDELMEGDKYG